MTLYTGCIYHQNHSGIRISIMNRHTLADGITLDSKITTQSYDRWEKSVAPPSQLLGDYYKRGLPWEEFERQYLLHIQKPELAPKLAQLIELASAQDITLLCQEETAERCHRRLLAQECKKIRPELNLVIG